jgi:hypothetical protein
MEMSNQEGGSNVVLGSWEVYQPYIWWVKARLRKKEKMG